MKTEHLGLNKALIDDVVDYDKHLNENWEKVDDTISTIQLDRRGINILSVGANGNGVTDDTQYFLNARVLFKDIYIPSGFTFIVDNLTLEDVNIYGPGTIKWKNSSTGFMLKLKGNCKINGVTFDGNGTSQTQANRVAIHLEQATNTAISNCVFTNFHSKIIVSDVHLSRFVTVKDNLFANNGTVNSCDILTVRSSDWTIIGNQFRDIGNGHCIRLGLYNTDPIVNPVERTIITANQFRNTQHVGITCEIYSRNITISGGNIFDRLDQAIKCEIAGSTVYDLVISGNYFSNIRLSTALNLSVPNVTFTNNICRDMGGGPYFEDNFDCSHNKFYDCGQEGGVVIGTQGSTPRGTVAYNTIVRAKFRAIALGAGTIIGNRIIATPDSAIRVSGAGSLITGNSIEGAGIGIQFVSTASETTLQGNRVTDCTTPFSYSNNTSFATNRISDNIGIVLPILIYTLANDTVTVSSSARIARVGTEGGASTDNLSTLNGGEIGQILTLSAQSVSQVVTVKNNVGNIRLGGSDFVMNSTLDALTLIFNGLAWIEVSRSDNA